MVKKDGISYEIDLAPNLRAQFYLCRGEMNSFGLVHENDFCGLRPTQRLVLEYVEILIFRQFLPSLDEI